nr:calmodulin-like protein 4 [Halyomorpha halys]
MALGGILSRQFTSALKNIANVVRPTIIPRRFESTKRTYKDIDVERVKGLYFIANRHVFDKLNSAEFNYFISMLIGRRFDSLDLRELFSMMDDNKDEYISMREIMRHLSKGLEDQKTGDLKYAFCRFDKDFDDFIYLHEAREAIFYLGFLQAGEKKITDFFYKRDTNDDKRLNYDEFAELVKKDLPTLFC